MDEFFGWVWNLILAFATALFTAAGFLAVRDEGWTVRGFGALVFALIVVLVFVRLLRPHQGPARAALATLALVGGVALSFRVGPEVVKRTDTPDAILRSDILGRWRLSYRLTAEDRGVTLPADADFVFQGYEEIAFRPRTVRITGEYVISAVSHATGSHEGRFETLELTRWRIKDATLTLTPMRGMTSWKPKPGHAPTRAFLKLFPMPEPDHEPREFHIKSLSRMKMVAVLVSTNAEGKTVKNEFVFHRVT